MDTAPVTGTVPQATDTTTSGLSSVSQGNLDRDDFLLLLVTQLQNQDPLNPLEGHEFAAQLAQFSSVEQLIGIGETLAQNNEANSILAQSINSGVAAGLIGKEVDALSTELSWAGDEVDFGFNLPQTAQSVEVTVLNDAGKPVRTFELGSRNGGEIDLRWDGRDDGGTELPEGRYTFSVQALDASGEPIAVDSSFTRGTVDRISFGPDGIQLWLDDVAIPMSAVLTVRNAS